MLGIHSHFGLRNFVVFCATLLQAVAVMKIVHWRHIKDISTDAIIKYFVSGFCLSTSLAIFFEVIVGLTMRLTMMILMQMGGIDVVQTVGFSFETSLLSPGFADIGLVKEVEDTTSYRDYLKIYGKDHPIVYTIYILINAFFLAATIEETCKYFGFRMIEHPDFLSRTELEEAAQVEETQNPQGRGSQTFPNQGRTRESRGAAITVAMVATALGFACCENLVYIFIYGSSNFDVQVVILLARSIFPVHPIAAALQSIRVCERDLEKRPGLSLGWIIFPGVVFHGVYDFLLMWIDFLSTRNGNYVDDDDTMDSDDRADWLSFVLSFVVMIGTLCYFFRESGRQRLRLRAMDQGSVVDQASLI
jgi:RsiW-degrading membrane proteinase PrsW (M82 family)